MKTITINGVKYREAPYTHPIAATEDGAICAQCALHGSPDCGTAIDGSPSVFGGDCMEHDIVYQVVAPNREGVTA